jgi:hypothetical protein
VVKCGYYVEFLVLRYMGIVIVDAFLCLTQPYGDGPAGREMHHCCLVCLVNVYMFLIRYIINFHREFCRWKVYV